MATIRISNEKLLDESVRNLTAEYIMRDEELREKIADYLSLDKDDSDYEEEVDYEIKERYFPMSNYFHVLESKYIPDDVMAEVTKLASSVCILYSEDMEAYFIGLTGAGMDFSESIELAYRLIDGRSPVTASNIYYLDDEAKERLLELREEQKGC